MAKMFVRFVSGISADRIEVKIFADSQDPVFEGEYSYGYNASYSRMFESAKQPFIGDILRNLVEDYYVGNGEIEYSGYNMFRQIKMTPEEVNSRVERILEEV